MHLDVIELRNFYAGPLGMVVRRQLAQRVRTRWRRVDGMTVVGLGFAAPYLGAFRGEALRLGALMPANQGALVWPSSGPVHTAMVEDETLPLADGVVDRMLAVHSLETAESARPLLREMWRVLAPEGRLLLIVPNRRSVWARTERTPFGHGRPYSRTQLERLLRDALFTPLDWETAIHVPPINRPGVLRWAGGFERLGTRISPGFAGVLMVEARKELHALIGKAAPARAVRELAAANGPAARRNTMRDPAGSS
jgi:SAM-dependent methyltransferase